jgi:cytochrome b561
MKTIVKNNLLEKYSKGIIIIHWLSFLLIILLIPLGYVMADLNPGTARLTLLKAHMVIGILVFALTLVRVWFFFNHKRPSRLETGNLLHNKLVVWMENSFYYVLILLCISGIVTITTGNLGGALLSSDASLLPESVDVPALRAHKALVVLLIFLLIGHLCGVINHYVKNKENTLRRIL